MELVSIDIKEFKKDMYADYKKLFPKEERKDFKGYRRRANRNE